jgi:hypothetical protein
MVTTQHALVDPPEPFTTYKHGMHAHDIPVGTLCISCQARQMFPSRRVDEGSPLDPCCYGRSGTLPCTSQTMPQL